MRTNPTRLDMKKAKRAEEKRPQIWTEVNFKCVPPQTGEDDDLVDVRVMKIFISIHSLP